MDFNDYCWHDAMIKNIFIDRSNPGINDTILFEVNWPNGAKSKLAFEDVYWAKFNLNFGIVSSENILSAYLAEKDNESLSDLRLKWKGLLNVELNCYIINLNSTGGEIKIISKGCRISEIK